MPEGKTIKLTPAKGRPMLQWVGKRPLERVTAFPAQLVEKFTPVPDTQGEGLIFHGDNKDVLAWLLTNGYRGKINLVYIDPPFDSGADYVRKVELRGGTTNVKMDSEGHTLGEQIQYTDIWANDNYLQFIFERLLLLKELLAEDGTLWIHCDYHRGHYLKCICDEVFAETNFIDEVVWKRAAPRGNVVRGLSVAHDNLLVYSKGHNPKWHPPTLPYTDEYKARFTNVDLDGRRYTLDNMISPNPDRPNLDYVWNGVRRVWRVTKEKMAALEAKGRIEYTSNGVARYKRYLDELDGQPLTTLWDDIAPVNSQAEERENYPTQKPEVLLNRIINTTSDPGDIVLDCFAGSGTTAAVAQKLGRRWIIADINKGAIQTASKRLQRIIQEQVETMQKAQSQSVSLADDVTGESQPAQLAFSVYRVNDYDLQIQHNEALNLAIEHVGIERLKSDSFFEGTLGKRLVKIIPFNHPLTRLDLQAIQDELKKRSNEDRDIVVVCLGKELVTDPWLTDYNHRHPVNKISVIELRTDPRYGKFFEHQPASMEVEVTRKDGKIVVDIVDFISPTILERLEMDSGMFKAKITDWRAMVDTVLIDTAYDGQVFNVALSDVPERKADMVVGHYELPAPVVETTVAVKIIDMLGEEALELNDV